MREGGREGWRTLIPIGGTAHRDALMLFGIHSTEDELFLATTCDIHTHPSLPPSFPPSLPSSR